MKKKAKKKGKTASASKKKKGVASRNKRPRKAVKQAGFPVTPLADRVIIKEIEPVKERTVSGIIVPVEEKGGESKRGKVVAVGKGKYDDGKLTPMTVKAGDEVLFGWGDKIKVGGDEYYIVRESEITAVFSPSGRSAEGRR